MLTLFLSLFLSVAEAHSGGTDAYGCHTDSSTGTSHCHNEGSTSSTGTTSSSGGDPIIVATAIATFVITIGVVVYVLNKKPNNGAKNIFPRKRREWKLDPNAV